MQRGAITTENKNTTALERQLSRIWAATACDRLPFAATLVFGFLAHMFAFANKLVNADEIESLFGKGATVTSGRWGLEAVKLIFPDYSMPWLYGLISLLLLGVAVCVIIRVFDIKGGLLRVLLAGMIVAFPSQTGTFCFMFTSSAYALSFLFAVLSVYFFCRGGVKNAVLSAALLTLSLGIYQAYIALTASLLLLYAMKLCLDGGENARRIIVFSLKALCMMVCALAVYALITLAVFIFTGAEFNDYVRDNANSAGVLGRIRMAYDFFVYYLSYREFALITGEAARWAHIALFSLCFIGVVIEAVKNIRAGRASVGALIVLAALLLPLAVNCMFLAMAKESIHTLVIYSFVAFYVLAEMLVERVFAGGELIKRAARDAVYAALTLSLASNVYFANEVYLDMYLEYENAYSFYTVLLARAENTDGFDESKTLALVGYQDNAVTTRPEIDLGYIMGPSRDLINIYSRENFIRRYIGSDIPLATQAELDSLAATDEFAAMSEYPYYGSIKIIGDYVVVKLG